MLRRELRQKPLCLPRPRKRASREELRVGEAQRVASLLRATLMHEARAIGEVEACALERS